MIRDALSGIASEPINADVCVIGAGAAGITLALALAGTRLRVCVLESGGFELDQVTQSLCEGENVGLDYFALDTTRLRYFGGSTGHWGGYCGPLTPIDLEERPWIRSSGWPITLDEMRPFYERAHRICEIGSTDYRTESLERLLGAPRLPLDPEYFETMVIRYSPPTHFGERYRAALEAADNVVVFLHANVLSLDVNERKDHVSRVRCATEDMKEFHVESRIYILAAGGIENPRILLLSNDVQAQGLGNGHDLVGRYFMDHPHRDAGLLVPEDPSRDVALYDGYAWRRNPNVAAGAYVTPSARLQREAKLLNGIIKFTPIYASINDGIKVYAEQLIDKIGRLIRTNHVIDVDTYHNIFQRQQDVSRFELMCSWEQSPYENSRVTLSHERDLFGQNRVRLDWRLNPADEGMMQRTLELFAREVGKANVGRLNVDIRVGDWGPGGHHHMGTTRMHADARHGVVDSDCRVHGLSNLYVAGSSVFPTSGAINPTLTIVALAERLADHLKARLSVSSGTASSVDAADELLEAD